MKNEAPVRICIINVGKTNLTEGDGASWKIYLLKFSAILMIFALGSTTI